MTGAEAAAFMVFGMLWSIVCIGLGRFLERGYTRGRF